MNSDRRKNAIRLKHLLRNLCQVALDELLKELETRIWEKPKNEHEASPMFLENVDKYRSVVRMTPDIFDMLLSLVAAKIQRMNTTMRTATPATIKLNITLDYLTLGPSYKRLGRIYQISCTSISKFIPEVCVEIYKALKKYIKMPTNDKEWAEIENGFKNKFNFPLCYGAIDGKHLKISANPVNNITHSYDKNMSTFVLMAIVDDDYCFQYIDIKACKIASDETSFKKCSIYNQLENNLLPIGGVIVADAAFPLKPYIMKPYPGDNLTLEQKVFNYRLSRTSRIVENTFGILANRFHVFQKPFSTDVNTMHKIVLAACALHNWLRKEHRDTYLIDSDVDQEDIEACTVIPGSWRTGTTSLESLCPQENDNPSISADQKRETFKNYFNDEGAVPWQTQMINYQSNNKIS